MNIPEILKSFYFDFNWDNKKVWALECADEKIPVAEIEWQLNFPFWSSQPPLPLFDLVPNDVLQKPDLNPVHWKRITEANLDYPIELLFFKERWILLDGFHRLARCKLEGRTFIAGRRHTFDAFVLNEL